MRADAELNRERILRAARGCFAARGYECELSVIAAEATVSMPTLFRHFASKKALGQAVLLQSLAESELAVRDALDSADPLAGLTSMLSHFVESLVPNRQLRFIEDELLEQKAVRRRREDVLEGATATLQRCQRVHLVADDVEIGDLLVLIDGIAIAAGDSQQRKRSLNIVLRGIAGGGEELLSSGVVTRTSGVRHARGEKIGGRQSGVSREDQ